MSRTIRLPLAVEDEPLLSIRGLTVTRGDRRVLNGITADLTRGRITALIGLNGSGKTTLLRTLLREFAFSGELQFRCGHDHSKPRPEHIGYVPQRLVLDSRLPLTVRDLLGITLNRRPLFWGLGRRRTQQLPALLERVGVRDLIDVPVEGLSGGQLQRVLLALALEPSPELLLLDEPAAGIDFQSQQGFYELIAELCRTLGVTILLVSHDLQLVSHFTHHVLCLRDGVVACQGPPAELLTGAALAETYGPAMRLFVHGHG